MQYRANTLSVWGFVVKFRVPLRASQYVADYLAERLSRAICPASRMNEMGFRQRSITPGSFLAARLRGNAKNYGAKYEQALRRAILDVEFCGLPVPVSPRTVGVGLESLFLPLFD